MARKASIAVGLLPRPIHLEGGSVQMHKSQAEMKREGLWGTEDQRHQIFLQSLSLHVPADLLPERSRRQILPSLILGRDKVSGPWEHRGGPDSGEGLPLLLLSPSTGQGHSCSLGDLLILGVSPNQCIPGMGTWHSFTHWKVVGRFQRCEKLTQKLTGGVEAW